MVKGLNTFKKYFEGYEDQYVLIGEILLELVNQNLRRLLAFLFVQFNSTNKGKRILIMPKVNI